MKDGRFTWEEEEETEEHSKASVVKDDKPNRSGETTRGSGETTSRSGETPSRPGEITSRSGTLRLRNININITQVWRLYNIVTLKMIGIFACYSVL